MAAPALEIEHGVDHMLDHAGAGDLAFLGDVADQNDRDADPLGKAGEFMCRSADLGDRTGGAVDIVGPHGLDRIDDGERRALGLERGEDVAQVGFGGELNRRVGEAKALRPHAHLGRGFFPGNVYRFQTLAGELRGGLQEQRRLADARVTADEDGRGGHEAAAEHAIEFAKPALRAGRRRFFAAEIGQLHGPAALAAQRFRGGTGGQRRFLGKRVPVAAIVAAAGPFGAARTAIRTDEARGFCHALGDA